MGVGVDLLKTKKLIINIRNAILFEGKESKKVSEYNSSNTRQLDKTELIELLAKIGYKRKN